MKCPYRIIETVDASGVLPTKTQEFAECYGEECPYYVPETKFDNLTCPEICGKVKIEELEALKKEKSTKWQ